MDDHSDERRTLRILDDKRRSGVAVFRPDHPVSINKRGGLYENMQQVWQRHLETRYALYMQDDQQIVRPVGVHDEALFQAYFDSPGTPPFLHVVFPRCVIYASDDDKPYTANQLDEMRATFNPVTSTFDSPKMAGVLDTGLWDVTRAKAAGWSFADDEAGNRARGHAMFGAGKIAATPFLAFLPVPMTHRNRRITLTRRVYFAFTSDVHPIDDLTPAQNARLLTNIGEPPLGDWYLHSSSFGGRAPWHALPMSNAPGWLQKLDVREQALRAHLASIRDSLRRRLLRTRGMPP